MTLIITTLQPSGCLITADAAYWSGGRIISDRNQKVFPILGSRLALTAHGRNELGGVPIKELVEEFIALRGKRLSTLGALRAAECAAAFFYPHAVVTTRVAGSANCGLQLIGFGTCCPRPHAIDILWDRMLDGHIWFQCNQMDDALTLLMAGNARAPIEQFFSADVVPGLGKGGLHLNGLAYGRRLHDELYARAVAGGTADRRPAGHRHRLRIIPNGEWAWEEPPYSPPPPAVPSPPPEPMAPKRPPTSRWAALRPSWRRK